jgi:hypothetical protein
LQKLTIVKEISGTKSEAKTDHSKVEQDKINKAGVWGPEKDFVGVVRGSFDCRVAFFCVWIEGEDCLDETKTHMHHRHHRLKFLSKVSKWPSKVR